MNPSAAMKASPMSESDLRYRGPYQSAKSSTSPYETAKKIASE